MRVHFDLVISFVGIYIFLHRRNYVSRNIYCTIVLVTNNWEHAYDFKRKLPKYVLNDKNYMQCTLYGILPFVYVFMCMYSMYVCVFFCVCTCIWWVKVGLQL